MIWWTLSQWGCLDVSFILSAVCEFEQQLAYQRQCALCNLRKLLTFMTVCKVYINAALCMVPMVMCKQVCCQLATAR